jgi:hypothetical protein
MVKLSRFAAVNPDQNANVELSKTLEAEEAAIIQLYETAILDACRRDYAAAEEAFRSLLEDRLVVSGATEQLQQLRALSRKNLAMTVSKQDGRDREALALLEAAIRDNPEDIGLIDRFATLSAKLGEWTAAKDAFVLGLEQDPTHRTMQIKLVEVLEHLNDEVMLASTPRRPHVNKNFLLRDLPAVSRSPMPINFGIGMPRKVIIEVADWIGLLRYVGRLQETYRGGSPLVEVQVQILDDNLEIELDLDEEDLGEERFGKGENNQYGETSVEEYRARSGGQKDDQIEDGRINQSDKSVQGGSKSHFTSPMPSQTSRRTRQHWDCCADLPRHEEKMAREGPDMNMLDELSVLVDDPSPDFFREVKSLQGAAVGVRSVLPQNESFDMLLSCTDIEWPLDALCELIVKYFSQSSDLVKLKDADGSLLMNLAEAMNLALPADNTITIAEWLVEKFCLLKEKSLGKGLRDEEVETELQRLMTLSKRLLLRVAVVTANVAHGNHDVEIQSNMGDTAGIGLIHADLEGELDGPSMGDLMPPDGRVIDGSSAILSVRYLFAMGKLMQAMDKIERAKECYSECLTILNRYDVGLRLDHLQDCTITASRVRFILESVDFHSEMGKIRSITEKKAGLQERLVALSSKVLSGFETESFMLGVDPSGWKSILAALIDASVKSNNASMSLRCQIRLLHALLPKGTADEVRAARLDPWKLLEPLFTVSFTSRLLNSTQIDRVIYQVSLEYIELDDYERDMLRDVLRRLLVIMHACHVYLSTTESASRITDRGMYKSCGVVMTYTSSFFVALLRVDLSLAVNDAVPVLERLFEELGHLNLLLGRKSMIPYFSIPLLCQLHSKMDQSAPFIGALENQLVHMLKFAFDLSLAPETEIGSYDVSFGMFKPRDIASVHEMLTIWPICEEVLASYGTKTLKDRAGRFVEKCYAIAAVHLPARIKSHMLAAIQKCGLQPPGRLCSLELQNPFLPFPLSQEPYFLAETGGEIPNLNHGASMDSRLNKVFTSIFDLMIKTSPIDMNAVGRQTDVASVDALECETEPYVWNVAFHPDKTDHWFTIGEFYLRLCNKVDELCFLEGRVPSDDEAAELIRRRNVAYWCLRIAGSCAEKELENLSIDSEGRQEFLAWVFEFYGRALMNESAECTGSGDTSERKQRALEEALEALIAATRFSPTKYSNHMHLGVCSKLLCHPPQEYLPALAHACRLAKQDPRGTTFIDPIFEMHAARMELLENAVDGFDDDIMALCALYRFSPVDDGEMGGRLRATSTSASTVAIITPKEMDPEVAVLYKDTVKAMEWCSEADRSYYKSSLRLAMSPLIEAPSRCEHLGYLFSNKNNRQFALGMGEVREKGPHLQKCKAKRKRAADTDQAFAAGLGFPTQMQAKLDIVNGVRYPAKACPETMIPLCKNLGIGADGTDTTRVHFLVTIRRALLEYVAILKDLGHIDKLEEIMEFLENSEGDCFKLAEFMDIVAYCRASCMILAIEGANATFPAHSLRSLKPEAFLSRESVFSGVSSPSDQYDADLEQVYDMYIDSLVMSKNEHAVTILKPVAKYMQWRLSRGDLSDIDELSGKLLITKRGLGLLCKYACLFVFTQTGKAARPGVGELTSRYGKFLEKVSGPDRIGLLGLVLLCHCHVLHEGPMDEKFLLHARECVQPLEGDDSGKARSDPLMPLRMFVKKSILMADAHGGPHDNDDVTDDDPGDNSADGYDRDGDESIQEPQKDRGIASMALSALRKHECVTSSNLVCN